ncbi:MAG: cytochrome d ubiquinol oxidase subunit II [Deltaproteobacteria bacterium]|nr:cytochrome d ubiquinol oxidase subunit II [Deltaproteobacteria bacterium]
MLADLVAGTLLVALVAYTVTGGADFGGGLWELFATGPRKARQRELVERAIAPIWEANHVWLILVVVVMFVALPVAFSAIMTALHIPLVIVLVGIVLRGAAFVFRGYDPEPAAGAERWRTVFAVASLVTPIFLGVCLGAIVSGGVRLHPDGRPAVGFVEAWATPVAFGVGAFVVVLVAWLAAVYLTVAAGDDRELADDFRRRALVTGLLAAAVGHALLAAGIGPSHTDGTRGTLVQLAVGVLGAGALHAVWTRAYKRARVLAAGQVAAIVVGLGLAMHPFVVPPDLTFERALAPPAVVEAMLVVLAIGTPLLLAALVWLYRVFRKPDPDAHP